jgi:hypothetical protein
MSMPFVPPVIASHRNNSQRFSNGMPVPAGTSGLPPRAAKGQQLTSTLTLKNESLPAVGRAASAMGAAAANPGYSVARAKAAAIQEGHRKCGEISRFTPEPRRSHTPGVTFTERDMLPRGREDRAADALLLSTEAISQKPWEVSRVDVVKMRDPYLRKYGLHKNDTLLQSHVIKRIFRTANYADRQPSVDFNFQYIP